MNTRELIKQVLRSERQDLRVNFEVSFKLEEFLEEVVDVLETQTVIPIDDSSLVRRALDAYHDSQPGNQIGGFELKLSNDDFFAFVIKNVFPIVVGVNPEAFSNFTRTKFEYVAVHEATHLLLDDDSTRRGHTRRFFRTLKKLLEERMGLPRRVQELFEMDIMMGGRVDIGLQDILDNPIFITTTESRTALSSLLQYLDNLNLIKQSIPKFNEYIEKVSGLEILNFRDELDIVFNTISLEGGVFSVIRPNKDHSSVNHIWKIGRGRGQQRLDLIKIDAESEEYEILEIEELPMVKKWEFKQENGNPTFDITISFLQDGVGLENLQDRLNSMAYKWIEFLEDFKEYLSESIDSVRIY